MLTWNNRPFANSMSFLIVEENDALRTEIRRAAASWSFGWSSASTPLAVFTTIQEARSVGEAMLALERPVDVVVVDTQLGPDSGLEVVQCASRLDRVPAVLAITDRATAGVGFALATLGARGCLGKPFEMADLHAAIQSMLAEPPDLAASAKAQVGYRHIHVVQDEVKSAMLKQAFVLEHGNITRAARRLGVTRTAVQQMLDRYGLPRSLTPRPVLDGTPAPDHAPPSGV